jgi:hypothetical protein
MRGVYQISLFFSKKKQKIMTFSTPNADPRLFGVRRKEKGSHSDETLRWEEITALDFEGLLGY